MSTIKNWLTGETILEYEGNLRAAVVQAVIDGKLLRGAYLSGANLSSAYLSGADLSGAYLSGAYLIDGGQRSDGYRFVLHNTGEEFRICAGCRYFTFDEARQHWSTRQRENPQLNAESLAIVDHLERLMAIRGWKLKSGVDVSALWGATA